MALNNAINAALPIAVANGGTGVETLTENGILLGNGTDPVSASAELADGQLLIGSTGNPPVAALLTAGAGINISVDPGEIVVSSAADTWEVVTSDEAMTVNTNYITNDTSLVTLTLPTTIPVGSSFEVTGINEGGWRVAQGADQQIHFGTVSSTVGATGYVESTEDRDSIKLVCVVENLEFNVLSAVGNIDVV